jgi:hypothetical protein
MIASLLTRWAKRRPNECWQTDKGAWAIGDYTFVVSPDTGILSAYHEQTGNRWVTGQPALDWLRGAVERAIRSSSGVCSIDTTWASGQLEVIINGASIDGYALRRDDTEALLQSYVEYLEGQE